MASEEPRYLIETEKSTDSLEAAVNRRIKLGYLPVGGVFTYKEEIPSSTGRSFDYSMVQFFAQALFKNA
jgi:hypothetical protein